MGIATFERLLHRYGQRVFLHYEGETAPVETRGFLEPVRNRQEQWQQRLPTPVGVMRQDRFVYFGSASLPLDALGNGYLLCRGSRYEIQTAQPLYLGDVCTHWWAILRLVEGEST